MRHCGVKVTNILGILVHTSSEIGLAYPYNPNTIGQYLTILTEINNGVTEKDLRDSLFRW